MRYSRRRSAYVYYLYGVRLRSQWRLPFPCQAVAERHLAEIDLTEGRASLFSEARRKARTPPNGAEWFQQARLPEGSTYLRWAGLFEFLISSDGGRITCRPLADASGEAFQVYLLGQVLSFALLKQGIESFHSTVVALDGLAVGFLGGPGYGKSSLAAAFLHAGYPLVTDDLLVVKEQGDSLFAYPGLPRIKLFPEVAIAFLCEQGPGTPMNPHTSKLVIPLDPRLSLQMAAPLRAIYVLRPPDQKDGDRRLIIRALNQRRSCLALIANTFNTRIKTPERLSRQFAVAARLAALVPVKSLSYPRLLSRLPAVVGAICADLKRGRQSLTRF